MTIGQLALARAGALGPFFAVATQADPPPDLVDWHEFSSLLAPDGAFLSRGVERTRATLAAQGRVEPAALDARVAASLLFLGWANRLVSPWVGAAVLTGVVPIVAVEDLRWRETAGQPVPLAVLGEVDVATPGPNAAALAVAMRDTCLQPFVEPLLAATAAAYSISEQVLWGNVASALAGAAGTVARAAPEHADAARALVTELLGDGQLRDRGAFVGARFHRQTCCLLYRVPGVGLCADCVLVDH